MLMHRIAMLLACSLGFLPAAEPRTTRPRGPWRERAPQIEAWLGLVPPARRAAMARHLLDHPGHDPSDLQAHHALALRLRGRLPARLDDGAARRHHAWLQLAEAAQRAAVAARAELTGVLEEAQDADGTRRSLVGFDGAEPVYVAAGNTRAAISTGADLVRLSSSFDPALGASIDGHGLYVNVNDHGTIHEHPEFQLPGGGSRIVYKELNDSGDRAHMTHVAGTVGAWGYDPALMGMAPRVWIRSHIQQSLTDITGHSMRWPGQPLTSINPRTGAVELGSVMGTTSLGATDGNISKGVYTATAAAFDQTLWDYPYYCHFFAAANNGAGGFSTLGLNHPAAKNVITIGSVTDVSRDTAGNYLSGGSLSSWSSRGPVFDGRIKPDLVANGESLTSPVSATSAGTKSGTSMATPNASGSSVLLISHFSQRFPGHYLRSSSLRALLINTCDDRGVTGPDYRHGWGIVNVHRAAGIIRRYADQPVSRVLVEDELDQGATWEVAYVSDGTTPIRVTLAWLDPAGTAQAGTTTDRSPRLVNDLDLRLVSPSGSVQLPLTMPYATGTTTTPAFATTLIEAPAVPGDNDTDNVEQILVAAPAAGTWTLRVAHEGALTGSQGFSLAIMGLAATAPLAPSVAGIAPASAQGYDTETLTVAGAGFVLGSEVSLRRTGYPEVQAFGEEVVGDRIVCRLDGAAIAPGRWDVVVRTPGGASASLPSAWLVPASGGGLPPSITSAPPPAGTAGTAYSHLVTTADPDTPGAGRILTVTGLPAGLAFTAHGDGTGTIAGTPTAAGTSALAISVSDGAYTVWQQADLVIAPAPAAPPTITVAVLDGVAGEPADGGAFRLTRSGPTTAALTVNLGVGGTASAADRSLPATATFAAGSATATVALAVLDDAAVEQAETATLTVTSGTGYAVGSPAAATITILDDDVLPAPWQTRDIGAVAAAGATSLASGTWTIAASGADIWGTADEGRFAWRTLSGDCSITARVASLQNTHAWAKAGVMLRESTAAGARFAMAAVTPGNGAMLQHRSATGASAAGTASQAATAPQWLRLTRTGSSILAERSADGLAWTALGSVNLAGAPADLLVGLVVCSHKDGTLATAVFDQVAVTAAPAQPPLTPAVAINFQPATAAIPAGHVADTGAVFGDRGAGRSYGWLNSANGDSRERNAHADQRWDTFNHLMKTTSRTWELAVVNGRYAVTIGCGDPSYTDSVNALRIEGVDSPDPDGNDYFDQHQVEVVVSDGRLTIAPGTGASNAKICFIEVLPVPSANN